MFRKSCSLIGTAVHANMAVAATRNLSNRAYQIDPDDPRGFCVVLDILNKPTATTDDIASIKKTFKELNFIVKVHENLTAKQLAAEAKKYYTIDHTNFYCFFGIVLSSTNDNGQVCDANGEPIKMESLLEGFCVNETLKGKPKVFLFQKTATMEEADPDAPVSAFEERQLADPSDLFVCRFTVFSKWKLQTTFFLEYKKAATVDRLRHCSLHAIVKEAQKNVNRHLKLIAGSQSGGPAFNIDYFNKLSHDLHLPLKGCEVNQRQVTEERLVDPCSVYPLMNKNMNGYCIIINNLGAEFENDCCRMEEVFRNELDFHVESFVLLSSQAIDELFKALSKIDHSEFNALAVILYGEGDHQAIKGCGDKGESLEMGDIENNFTYENCPTLSSKPKLFIFNLMKQATAKRKERSHDSDRERLYSTGSSASADDQPQSATPDVFCLFNILEATDSSAENRFAFTFTKAVRRSNDDCNTLDMIAAACLRDGLIRPTIGRTMKLTSGSASTRPVNNADFRQSRLAADLKMVYPVWKIIRSRTIERISVNKDKLANLAKDVRISRIAGASAGVVGGAVAVAGFVLLPFTFGGSIVVSAAGAGLATAGGLTSIGATIAQKIIENGELKKVNNLISIDHQLSQIIHDLIEILQDEAQRLSTDNPGASKEVWLTGILRSADAVLRIGSVGAKGAIFGIQAAGVGALEGSVAIARIGTVGASVGFAVAGGALNVILLPISIAELSINVFRLAKDKNTKTMQVLEDLIKELCKSLEEAEKFIEQNNINDQQEANSSTMSQPTSVELFACQL